MPKVDIDYSNTIIYKIVCRDLTIKNCYVGHTTNFTKRKAKHKHNCNSRNYYVYEFINANGGWNNWDMVLIEKYPCNDLYEASARERHWIEHTNADLNQRIPPTGLTHTEVVKQYQINNREKIAQYQKQYRIQYESKNADKLKNDGKQKYITNINKRSSRICCLLCKSEMRFDNLTRHRKDHH